MIQQKQVSATDFFAPDIEYMVARKCTPVWKISEQPLTMCNITYVTKGAAKYHINGQRYDLAAGDLFCPPPDSIFEAVVCPENLMNCFSVNFYIKNAMGENALLPFPILNHLGVRHDLTSRFFELKNAWTEQTPVHAIKARGVFLMLLYQLFELIVYDLDFDARDYRIKKAVRYIAEHYAEKVSVKQLSEQACLNAVYFGALFKKETGMSLHSYLTKVRIRNAENLLKSGEYQVCEVAEECGFADIYHFYRQFKSIKGFSPSKCIPRGGLS